MMRSITVKEGQTLLDIAMQEAGDVARALEIATANGISLTDDLVAGMALLVPDPEVSKAEVAELLKRVYNIPASSDNDDDQGEDENTNGSGIGFWIIEQTFIVK